MGIGIIAIIVGILILFRMFKRVPNQKKVTGIIHSNNFYVQYVVDGKEYLLKSKYILRTKKIGKNITVKYNSKQPEEAIVVEKSGYFIAIIFMCFGICAICSTIIINNNSNGACCTCLDCLECAVCCDCNNPYLNQ